MTPQTQHYGIIRANNLTQDRYLGGRKVVTGILALPKVELISGPMGFICVKRIFTRGKSQYQLYPLLETLNSP
jgi:hypothetical protein